MLEQVGPFEVLREVGCGGMGVVYLARDTRLDRDVAIKALPEHLASDPARLERFEREAKTLAGLSHSNVAGIHGVEEQDGAKYLVLEYVDGETLADRLDRGPLPVDETIEYAVQIAAGVEAAHEAGVIHRDLKPANIKISSEGIIKVLDFGLARADEGGQSSTGALDSPTMTTPQPQHSPTIEGAILGTAAYMSPEQARGRRVDKRTDIWSFGVLLYEMLVGASPFHGETATDSIGAVLHKDLDLDRLPDETPANVRRVLDRCLVRDKTLRYRDIGDVRVELMQADATQDVDREQKKVGLGSLLPAVVGTAVIVAVIAGAAGWFARSERAEPSEADRRVVKIDIESFGPDSGAWRRSPQISPDGRRIATIRDAQVWVRDLNAFEAVPISGTDGAERVFWSPDSREIGYSTNSGLFRISPTGIVSKIADVDTAYPSRWLSDDRVLVSVSEAGEERLVAVSSRGGEFVDVLEPDPELSSHFHGVSNIPGTDVILYSDHLLTGNTPIMAWDGEQAVEIVNFADMYWSSFDWSPSGHVVFTRGFGSPKLWAVPFDSKAMRTTGEPFLVMHDANIPSISKDGTLVVLRGNAPSGGTLSWIGRDGTTETITSVGTHMALPVVSPDGNLVAFSSGESPANSDIWIHDFEQGFNTRISREGTFTAAIAFSADSTELAYIRFEPLEDVPVRTHFVAVDGSGETRPPQDGPLMSFDKDWTVALLGADPLRPGAEARLVSMDDGQMGEPLFNASFGGGSEASISPDGKYVLFASGSGDEQQLYCGELPDVRRRWRVTPDVGSHGVWSHDGTEIYYKQDDSYVTVSVTYEPTPRFSPPEPLFAESTDMKSISSLGIAPDPERFVIVRQTDNDDEQEQSEMHVSVIRNWFEEFRDNGQR